MENQLITDGLIIGQNLDEGHVDSLSQDQLGQLYELQQEVKRSKGDNDTS